jgi:cell division protein FtsN
MPSNLYKSPGRKAEQIELKETKKTTQRFKSQHNESQDEKDEIEESNSLKPSTKEELKKSKNKCKVSPEKALEKPNVFKKKITYLNVTPKELIERKISPWRIKVADLMRSKPVDIFIITLIILYTLLVIVYLAIDDLIEDENEVELILQIVELVFLFVF